jgi:hypothetical protein
MVVDEKERKIKNSKKRKRFPLSPIERYFVKDNANYR